MCPIRAAVTALKNRMPSLSCYFDHRYHEISCNSATRFACLPYCLCDPAYNELCISEHRDQRLQRTYEISYKIRPKNVVV